MVNYQTKHIKILQKNKQQIDRRTHTWIEIHVDRNKQGNRNF